MISAGKHIMLNDVNCVRPLFKLALVKCTSATYWGRIKQDRCCSGNAYFDCVFSDPMVSLTAGNFPVAEEDGSFDICAVLNNVLAPGGTAVPITVNLIVTSGTASMSSQIPHVARHLQYAHLKHCTFFY